MGTIQHKAVLVTGSDFGEMRLTTAHKKAKELFPKQLVSDILEAVTNGYGSFFIAPCGSKIGWPDEDSHQDSINKLVEFLEELKYEDGSTSVKYLYVTFGELGLTVQDYMGHDVYEDEDG